jgi:hypothetical protein
MATQADVRRIALSLPGAEQARGRFAYSVRNKGKPKEFVWVWMERVTPKKPRVPNFGVIAVRVANLAERERLLAADPAKFFTEPHYEGFPAVLVRLDAVTAADLKPLLEEAWRCQAPKDLHLKRILLTLFLASVGTPLFAQQLPLPIVDVHLHAEAADAQGPPPLAVCTPLQGAVLYNNAARFLRFSDGEIARHHGR